MEDQINLSQCLSYWTRWIATRAFVAAAVLLSAAAWGATPPVHSVMQASNCGGALKDKMKGEKLFHASFVDRSSGEIQEMQLAIHRIPAGKKKEPEIIAQISNKNGCEAVCQLRRFDPESPLAAQSMDMDCRSSGLGHLVTPATVFWGKTRPAKESDRQPALRFGTWLNGYVRVPLRVELDRFVATEIANSAPVLKAKAMHVASARAQN